MLECKLLGLYTFCILAEAGQGVFRYIGGWHNPRRHHSALDNLSPANFEAKKWRESVGISGLAEVPVVGEGHLVESGSTLLQPAEALLTPRKEEEDIKLKELQYSPVR